MKIRREAKKLRRSRHRRLDLQRDYGISPFTCVVTFNELLGISLVGKLCLRYIDNDDNNDRQKCHELVERMRHLSDLIRTSLWAWNIITKLIEIDFQVKCGIICITDCRYQRRIAEIYLFFLWKDWHQRVQLVSLKIIHCYLLSNSQVSPRLSVSTYFSPCTIYINLLYDVRSWADTSSSKYNESEVYVDIYVRPYIRDKRVREHAGTNGKEKERERERGEERKAKKRISKGGEQSFERRDGRDRYRKASWRPSPSQIVSQRASE